MNWCILSFAAVVVATLSIVSGQQASYGPESGVEFSNFTPEEGFYLDTDYGTIDIYSFTFVFDMYLAASQPQTFGGFVQLQSDNVEDGDLFLRDDGGSFSIGISGDYDGVVLPETWTRIVFTFLNMGGGVGRLGKFVDGELVGEQTIDTGRFRVSPNDGLLFLTDNDNETYNGKIALISFIKRAVPDDEVASLGGAAPGGLGLQENVVEFEMSEFTADGVLEATTGQGRLLDRSVLVQYDDSDGHAFTHSGPEGGYSLVMDFGSGFPQYTLVYDLLLEEEQPATFGSLLQLDGENQSDGELFLRRDETSFSIGISGDYAGSIRFNAWTRIVFTLTDLGGGFSRLVKYVDGALVGEQTVDSQRFRIGSSLFIFSDNDNETFNGRIGAFAGVGRPLSDEEVSELGIAKPNGVFLEADSIVFDFSRSVFRNGQIMATIGSAVLVDRSFDEILPYDAGLAFQAWGPDGGWRVEADYGEGLSSFSLVYDLLLPVNQPGTYGGLIQLDGINESDGELFLRAGDGAFGIGISGQYDGSIAPDTWTRIAFTCSTIDGMSSRLAKFVDGVLVGEQTVDTTRFQVLPDNGVIILSDNDSETFNGRIRAFALIKEAIDDDAVASLGSVDSGLILNSDDLDFIEFNFEMKTFRQASLTAQSGNGFLVDRLFSDRYADDSGIALTIAGPDGGYRLDADYGDGLESYTIVFDLWLEAEQTAGFGALIQTDGTNNSDGDLFLRNDGETFSIGISGDYGGIVVPEQWTRIVFTAAAQDNVESRLQKFVDGVLVGEQTVSRDRFAINPQNQLWLFTDNDGELFNGRVGAFALQAEALSENSIHALGSASPGGIFQATTDDLVEFDFNRESEFINGAIPAVLSDARFVDRLFRSLYGIDDGFAFRNWGPGGGLLLDVDFVNQFSAYTLIFDLLISRDQVVSFGSLWQTDGLNAGDGDLFLRDDGASFASGISGQYDGVMLPETWTRVAFIIDAISDIESVLTKFVDGEIVGTQTVETSRYVIPPSTGGLMLLADNDGETFEGRIAKFVFVGSALPIEKISELGNAVPGALELENNSTVFEFDLHPDSFDNGRAESQLGNGVLVNRLFDPVPVVNPVAHHLIEVGQSFSVDLHMVFEGADLTFDVSREGNAVDFSLEGAVLLISAVSLGVSDFVVTAKDRFDGTGSDLFRVRVGGPGSYSFIVLPDTQNYSDGYDSAFDAITSWIAKNAATQKIALVSHVGDVVGSNNAPQWAVASSAYEKLDSAGIPYTLLPGNHDQAAGGSANDYSTNMDSVFPAERYFQSAVGGTYDGEESIANNYKLITTPDGTDWIILSIEFGARDDVLRWGNEILTRYSSRRAIVLSHHVVNGGDINAPHGEPFYGESQPKGSYGIRNSIFGANDGLDLWDKLLSKHGNIAFVFSGHVFFDGAETIYRYTEQGNVVVQFLVNYQDGVSREIQTAGANTGSGNGGNGALRLLIVDPAENVVHTETYFVMLDRFMAFSRGEATLSRDGLGERPLFERELQPVTFGSTSQLGLDPIPGDDGSAEVIIVPRFNPDNGLRVEPGFEPSTGTRTYESYTMVWDMFIPSVIGLTSILQTDLNNQNDGDLWIQMDSSGGGLIGANFQDDGPFDINTWSRVVVVFERVGSDVIQYLCNKFVNGRLIGTQVFDGDRRTVKSGGWLLFADDGLETPLNWGLSSFAFVERALSADEVAALGGVDANGPFDGPLSGANAVQFAFNGGQFVTTFGNGRMSQEVGERTPLQLTGPFRGHAETLTGVGVVGPAEKQFRANAGSDFEINLSTSSGSFTLVGVVHDPLDQVVLYEWKNENGLTIGRSASVEIDVVLGTQEFTFVCYDKQGHSNSDVVRVTGTNYETVLFDNFDDGSLDGWTVSSGLIFAAGPVQSGTGTKDGRMQFSRSSQPGSALFRGDVEYTDNYRIEALINNESLQACGMVIGYSDAGHYRLSFEVGSHSIRIEKFQGENVILLAEQRDMGYYDQHFTASLALSEGSISASVNHQVLFGGSVVDPGTRLSGIAGFFHEGVFRMDIDNVFIQAKPLFVNIGRDELVVIPPGGNVELELQAETNASGEVVFLVNGKEVSSPDNGISISEEGNHVIRAVATHESDSVWSAKTVRAISKARVVVEETFESLNGWNFIDRGELNDPANWVIENGSLVQSSNRKSRQSMGVGEESPSVEWSLGWSPLGDGFHILRLGATAIWADPQALSWRDYTIVVDFDSPSGGGVGILFRYQDEDNFIKLELDKTGGSSALTQIEAGVEQIQWQSQTGYDSFGTNTLQIAVIGRRVSAQLDGYPLFIPVEFRTLDSGTVGLYTWDSPGTAFKRLLVVDEEADSAPTSSPSAPTLEVPKCRRRSLR